MTAKLASLLFVSSLAVCPRAQQEPAPPRPVAVEPASITLLLTKHAPPAVGAWQRRLQKVVGEPLVEILSADHGGVCKGAVGDAGFRVRFVDGPRAFDESERAALDDELVPAVRAHRGHCVIECDATTKAEQVDAYRIAAKVAASLLRRGASAISFGCYGEWRAIDEDTRDALLGDDVLTVFEPTAATSLVAFVRARRDWERAALTKKLAAELQVEFDGEQRFVVARNGMAVVMLDGQMVFLSWRPRAEIDDARLEMRTAKMVRDHQALLHVMTSGPVRADAEAERRRLVARIVAALWDDDVLGVNWHCDQRMIVRSDELRDALRAADPVAATLGGGAPPVLRDFDEQAMQRAIAEARETWPKAVAHLQAGGELAAKFPFATRTSGTEHIWVSVDEVVDGVVRGRLANAPVDVEGKQLGSAVSCDVAELSDWYYLQDGEMVGGFTVKVLRKRAEAGEKK